MSGQPERLRALLLSVVYALKAADGEPLGACPLLHLFKRIPAFGAPEERGGSTGALTRCPCLGCTAPPTRKGLDKRVELAKLARWDTAARQLCNLVNWDEKCPELKQRPTGN